MGQRNKEKRAAKKRRKQQRGPTPPRGGSPERHGPHGPGCTCDDTDVFGGGFGGEAPWMSAPSADALVEVLLIAAQAQGDDDPGAAVSCSSELSETIAPRHERTLGTAASIALSRVLGSLWQGGWMPADLWELARRRTDAMATSLLVDTIAADTGRHAQATVHDRWAEHVRWIDAAVWWNEGHPHLGQWAGHHGLDTEQALHTTIMLLTQMMLLPKLPQIVPPPGTASNRSTASAAGVAPNILARVRGLLAKAESTEFPDEAEALSAKAQELMNRYAFERALLDAENPEQQTATSVRLWLDSPYVEAKSHLVSAIAEANRSKTVMYPKLGFIAVVGEAMDLEITELLTTSLLIQATRAMLAEGRHITGAGTSRTRSFRQSFLVSYATRIGERLDEASSRAHDAAEDERLLPVLAARSRVVDETFNEMFQHTVEKAISASNGAGWHAGRAAADRADLSVERPKVNA